MKKNILEKIQETTKRYANQMGYAKKQPIKEMTMREMLRKTRKKQISEENLEIPTEKQITKSEQEKYERNMLSYFENDNLTIKFEPILLYDNAVFWGGTIDGQLKFAYFVTPDEHTSGVKIERSPDFDPTNEDNQKVEKKVIDYYDVFYKYWTTNEFEN